MDNSWCGECRAPELTRLTGFKKPDCYDKFQMASAVAPTGKSAASILCCRRLAGARVAGVIWAVCWPVVALYGGPRLLKFINLELNVLVLACGTPRPHAPQQRKRLHIKLGMTLLEIRLLGQFEVRGDGTTIEIASRPAQFLLAYLALHPGTPLRREKLAGSLWPDASETNARNYLRSALWRLRQALPAEVHDSLLADNLSIRFGPAANCQVDVTTLERAEPENVPLSEVIAGLIGQVAAYRGELLPGFYDDWVLLERERLQAIFERKLERLLECLVAAGQWSEVRDWSERWIATGSVPEPAYRALMQAHGALGDMAQLAATYGRCVAALREQLSVEPSAQTRLLYEQLSRSDPLTGSPPMPGAAAPAVEAAPLAGEPPFKGLQHFEVADAGLFFGRERLTTRLAALLSEHRFLAVVGASGGGKSSLVRAGLISAMARGQSLVMGAEGLQSVSDWQIHLITPTAHPLESLALSLTVAAESVTAAATLMDDLLRDPRSLHLAARRLLSRRGGERLLVVVDQFEELFTLCDAEAERTAFVDNLLTAVDGAGPVTVVIALRADFYAHCGPYPRLREALEQHQAYIGPMQVDEMRRAVEEPVKRGGWAWEPGLVDLILRDAGAGDEPGALPLLSHALLETWKRRSGRSLTFGGYAAAGGVRGAIAQTAQGVYEGLTPEQQSIARGIFLRLTDLGEGTQDSRRRATLAELLPLEEADPNRRHLSEGVLRKLVDARLITTTQTTVEVAHEAVLHEWPTLREWLNDNREGLRLHRRLSEAAQAWARAGRDPGELYRAGRLARAQEWAGGPARIEPLSELEREFLQASLKQLEIETAEHDAQRQRELAAAQALAQAAQERAETQLQSAARLRRRNRYLIGLGAVALALAGATGVYGVQANQTALQAVGQANRSVSQRLAAQAAGLLQTQPDLAALLSVEALRANNTLEARDALLKALEDFPSIFVRRSRSTEGMIPAFSPDGRLLAVGNQDGSIKFLNAATFEPVGQTLTGHVDWVSSLVFSPDGKLLASGSDDNTMRLWDVANRQPIGSPLTGPTGEWIAVAFSPDGRLLASNGPDGTVRLWDVAAGKPLGQPLTGHADFVSALSFSPDSKTLATSSFDKSVILWDTTTGQPKGGPLVGPRSAMYTVAFGPDGRTIATGSLDGSVTLWDVDTGQALRPDLAGHTAVVFTVAFSPDGRFLATGGRDDTILLWDLATHQRSGQPIITRSAVHRLLFSSDGKTLISGGFDNQLVEWQVTTSQTLSHPLAGGMAALTVAYSRDGRLLATGGTDGTVRLYDAASEQPIGAPLARHTGSVRQLAFSADGKLLASAGDDLALRLWDTATGQPITHQLAIHSGQVTSLAFSPAGPVLATGNGSGDITLWDSTSGQALGSLGTGQKSKIDRIAFSPDGRTLAASQNNIIVLWDVASRRLMGPPLSGHGGYIAGLAFSPDSQRLASGGMDWTVRLWDVASGKPIGQPLNAHAGVTGVSFSPDGALLAGSSADKTIRLWDAATRQALGEPLQAPGNGVDALAFSPDAKTLASTSAAGPLLLWDFNLSSWQARGCAISGRNLTRSEWEQYLAGQAYRATCAQWVSQP
jgi:WD40 repeat protein/DNA-binding SARP family transcriptional activator